MTTAVSGHDILGGLREALAWVEVRGKQAFTWGGGKSPQGDWSLSRGSKNTLHQPLTSLEAAKQ